MNIYQFSVIVYPNGKQSPQIIFNETKFENLNNFLGDIYSNINILEHTINNIEQVLDKKLEFCAFGESERQNILVRFDKSEVYNSFDEFDTFYVESILIYNVMKDWLNFIKQWKANKIPNLKYPY